MVEDRGVDRTLAPWRGARGGGLRGRGAPRDARRAGIRRGGVRRAGAAARHRHRRVVARPAPRARARPGPPSSRGCARRTPRLSAVPEGPPSPSARASLTSPRARADARGAEARQPAGRPPRECTPGRPSSRWRSDDAARMVAARIKEKVEAQHTRSRRARYHDTHDTEHHRDALAVGDGVSVALADVSSLCDASDEKNSDFDLATALVRVADESRVRRRVGGVRRDPFRRAAQVPAATAARSRVRERGRRARSSRARGAGGARAVLRCGGVAVRGGPGGRKGGSAFAARARGARRAERSTKRWASYSGRTSFRPGRSFLTVLTERSLPPSRGDRSRRVRRPDVACARAATRRSSATGRA